MDKTRIELFSDAILAVAITIIVLEMEVPKGHFINDFWHIVDECISYAGSFFFISIFWLKHNKLFHSVKKIDSKVLRMNLIFLFWISLLPFATRWIDGGNLEKSPTVMYALILFMSGISFQLLEYYVMKVENQGFRLIDILKKDTKGTIINILSLITIVVALFNAESAILLLTLIAILLAISDKRFKKENKTEE